MFKKCKRESTGAQIMEGERLKRLKYFLNLQAITIFELNGLAA